MIPEQSLPLRPIHFLIALVLLLMLATTAWIAYALFIQPAATAVPTRLAVESPQEETAVATQPAPVILISTLSPTTLLPTPTLANNVAPIAIATTTTTTMPTPTSTTSPLPPTTATFTATATIYIYPLPVEEAEVEGILSRLTLEQKIGQMLMVGVPGSTVDDLTRRRIAQQGVGGVIFLEKNGVTPQQVRDFTTALQALSVEQGTGIPLFIGWNHEGGSVTRRGAGLTRFPHTMALGATGNPDLAYAVGRVMGVEMHSLGVNMNFAPVLDVNSEPANPVIGLRSFGNISTTVTSMGQQYINGLQSTGVIGVAKHFPGHGAVNVDSHIDLPLLSASVAQMQARELPPFRAALAANVGGVMVAHLQIPALDASGLPSSMSPEVINTLLRQEMGYDGVVMTDDIGMGAIVNYYSVAEAAVLSVLAGNDLLLMVDTQTYPDIAQQALLTAVNNGRIPPERIDQSVRRLLRLKLAYDLATPSSLPLLPDPAAHQELAFRVGVTAVQKIRDTNNWIPLQLPNQTIVLVSPQTINPGTISGDWQSVIGEAFAAAGVTVIELFYNPLDAASIATIQAQALYNLGFADAAVVITWDANLQFARSGSTAQEQMITTLLTSGKPVITAFGQLPYDSQRLLSAPAQLAMYGDSAGQAQGLVNWLIARE